MTAFLLRLGPLPSGRHDGTRLRDDRGDCPLLEWLCQRPPSLRQDRSHLQAVFRTTLIAAPLRLRHEGRQVGPHSRGKPQGEAAWCHNRYSTASIAAGHVCTVFAAACFAIISATN